jgi:hypothetical protein
LGIGLSGGRPITLASGVSVPGAIAADATNVYWVTGGTLVNDYHDATVMKVSARGGLATTLASNQAGYAAMGIAVDAASVYWTNYDGGTVMKVAICGGALTTLASGQNRPAGIAVDSSSVYWTTWADGSNGTVMKATPK